VLLTVITYWDEVTYLIEIKKNIAVLLLVMAGLTACDMFATRNPEEPDSGKSSFIPPTSPSIVVSNFISAVAEKNVENYLLCLSDTVQSDKFYFNFKSTADAFALYSSIFVNWSRHSERNYFNKLITNMPKEVYPKISLNNTRFEVLLPDSAIFVADYDLKVEHLINSVNKHFNGRLQFSIFPRENGLWSIKSWYDYDVIQDTIQSWSFLKAQLAN